MIQSFVWIFFSIGLKSSKIPTFFLQIKEALNFIPRKKNCVHIHTEHMPNVNKVPEHYLF